MASRALVAALVATAAGLLGVACGDGGGGDGDATPDGDGGPAPVVRVTTTLPVFADFVRQAGGDRVDVLAILPDGVPTGMAELSPEASEWIDGSGLVLYNGLDLETTAEDLLFAHKRRGSQIVEYSRDVASPTREGLTASAAGDNPYLWLDPIVALTYVDTTWDSLVIVDGAAESTYRANAAAYREKLGSLHAEIEEKVASIPSGNRKLVAFDESFFHLANRYGLEPVLLPAPDSTDEPSPRRIEGWAGLLGEQGVPAVFADAGFNSALLTQAARRAEVEVCTLYSDTFDDVVTSYIEMMTFNADELARCLGAE